MEIKEIIKTGRMELGLTLEDIAKKVGVSKPTVQRWESGDIENMRRDKIAKLAETLKMQPTELLGWEKTEPQKKDYFVPDKYKDVMFAFENGAENLTQEDIDDVIKFIEFLKNKKK